MNPLPVEIAGHFGALEAHADGEDVGREDEVRHVDQEQVQRIQPSSLTSTSALRPANSPDGHYGQVNPAAQGHR